MLFYGRSRRSQLLEVLESHELNLSQGPDSDGVLVSEFEKSVEPFCEWLELASYKKSLIGFKTGSRPNRIVAREDWDPEVGSGLVRQDPETKFEDLEFVRLDGNVEVYLDKKTGREVYTARTSTPVEALFKSAAAILEKYFVHSGQHPFVGDEADEIRKALAMLEQAEKESADSWQIHFYIGKGYQSLGRDEESFAAFSKAYELENQQEFVLRELAGSCLATGRFTEATQIGEKAVAIEPDNSELIGNLALAYLMARRLDEAMKTISAARSMNPEDRINRNIQKIITEVAEGRRAQPETFASLRG